MPTIKDIAREAGVSHGTVSNVINGRGNVSVEKIRLVWQAAEKLGYKVNAKAQSLRLGKDRAIAVMLPGIEYTHWAAMYEVFQSEFSQRGYSVQLYSTRSMESRELSLLTEALNARFSAIITSTCLTWMHCPTTGRSSGPAAGFFAAGRSGTAGCDVRRF